MVASGGMLEIMISFPGAEGVVTLQRSLATFGMRVADMSPAWREVGEKLQYDFAKNFEGEGGQFGGWSKWAPLAESTVAERRRLGYGAAHPILQRTGALYESVVVEGAPDNVFQVKPNGLQLGSTLYYAAFHEYGTVRMPRRAVVGLSAERRGFGAPSESVVGILSAYLMQALHDANLEARGFESMSGDDYVIEDPMQGL